MLCNTLMRTAGLRGSLSILSITTVVACSSGSKAADTTSAAAAPAANGAAPGGGGAMSASDSMTGMKNMQGMNGMAMTGDADRDFLRMMSDHHKGMIIMAHMTKDMKGVGTAATDAEKLDGKQDVELDKMMTMLEKTYKDPYVAKVLPDNQAMADALKGKAGTDYERTFYQNVIKHHSEAVKMVDDYLPHAKSATVKMMAEKMKADQTKEITAFQGKLGKMK